jgi:hypothetical protein
MKIFLSYRKKCPSSSKKNPSGRKIKTLCEDSYFYKSRLLSFLDSIYLTLNQAVSGLERDPLFITLEGSDAIPIAPTLE